MIPTLSGVHHLKLPVSDLDQSIRWYGSRLGYHVVIEFREHGRLTGVAMAHPDGGPHFALNLNPDRALASAGFDYFSIGEAVACRSARVPKPKAWDAVNGTAQLVVPSAAAEPGYGCRSTLMARRSSMAL